MKHQVFVASMAALGMVVLPAAAQDCDSIGDSVQRAPDWYLQQCVQANGSGADNVPAAPTDPAVALDLASQNVFEHPLNDFSNQTVTGSSTRTIFAMESSADGSVVYAIDDATNEFGAVDSTGTFSVIGTLSPEMGHTWTGLTAGPLGVFASSTDGATTALYSVDPAAGTNTLIGTQSTAPLLIDIAMTCSGEMFGHDIGNDSIYSIDPANGAATLIGPTGRDANFAQGMTVDRDTGTVYLYMFDNVAGDTAYGTVDLTTGAFNEINAPAAPVEEVEGATTTSCGTVLPPAPAIPTLNRWGLSALVIALLGISGWALMRRRDDAA